MHFEWDEAKERINIARHGVDFTDAQKAFADSNRIVGFNARHSDWCELRWLLLGRVDGRILSVVYTHRPKGNIRLISAGFWRAGRMQYEELWNSEKDGD